jgi:putative peptide zinc metalloprotease protein
VNGGAANPKLRVDLVHRQTEMGDSLCWVVHDPIAGQYFHFTESEHRLLMLADGTRQLTDIHQQARQQVSDQTVSLQAIVSFFQQAKTSHLLDGEISQTANVLPAWWLRVLAIRFPGISPDRFLERLEFLTPFVFSRWSWRLLGLFAPLAVLLTLSRLDVWTKEFAQATLAPASTWIMIVVAISVTKLIHETAHALACKYVRCDCREMGVMLLCGIPCLYVDVSDAWLLRKTRDRMLVSAAGILAECWIATLATFVWLVTDSGMIHQISLVLMVVCSVSTILINGNPLLRYDGYYVLSDATGTPNLASESRRVLRQFLSRDHAQNSSVYSVRKIWFLIVYALLSTVYRILLYTIIFGVLYSAADSVGLSAIVVGLFACIGVSKAMAWFLTTKNRPATEPMNRPQRTLSVLVAIVVVVVGLIPLPRRVIAPAEIIAAQSQDIFVSTPGYVTKAPVFGIEVEPGQSLVQLYNGETLRHHAEAVASQSVWETRLRVLQQSRHLNAELSEQIPAATASLGSQVSRVEMLGRQAESLEIRSPAHGVLYPPANQPPNVSTVSLDRGRALTSPSHRFECGRWLAAGTVIGSVGSANQREANAWVDQSEIGRVRLGQPVTLLVQDHERGSIVGTVVAISSSPVELASALSDSNESSTVSSNPLYRIRIRIADGEHTLPVHRRVTVAIQVDRASIGNRIQDVITEAMR